MRYLYITVIAFIASTLHAQQTPFFQTQIFFEDAVGNRDTITLGFDPNANYEYNPQFGEMDISAPYDSVFEVRAVHELDYSGPNGNYVFSKKIIGDVEIPVNDSMCLGPEEILFFIKCVHQPVSVQWSRDTFRDLYCLSPTYFTPDNYHSIVWPWNWFENPDIRYRCTYFDSTYTLYLGSAYTPAYELPYTTNRMVLGQTAPESIYGISLVFQINWVFSPCQFSLDAQEPDRRGASPDFAYPNPAISEIHIKSIGQEAAEQVLISDCSGRFVADLKNRSQEPVFTVDLTRFPPGLYFYRTHYKNGVNGQGKFVKLE